MEPLREGARIAIESRHADPGARSGMYASARNPQAGERRVPLGRRLHRRPVLRAARRRRRAAAARDVQPGRRPSDDRRQPGSAARVRSSRRSSTSSRSPARSSPRSARPTSAPAPGPTPGSRSTPRSASRPVRRPSCRPARCSITKTPLGADTFGGYVNVSKQDINRSLAGDPRHGHQRPRRAVRHRDRGGGRRR